MSALASESDYWLRELKLEVTYRCPLACIHCSSEATPDSPLTMQRDRCLGILAEAGTMGVEEVVLSGGEPLTWPALDEAVKLASAEQLAITLYSSGNVDDVERQIQGLVSLGVARWCFSLFGATQEGHQLITRRRDSYEKTLYAIDATRGAGAAAEIHFVPMSSTFRQLSELVRLAADHGVDTISLLRLVPHGRAGQLKNELLSHAENVELGKIVRGLRSSESGPTIRTGSPYNFLMLNEDPVCMAAVDRLVVGPDLRVYPCDAFKQVRAEELVGTLQGSSLDRESLPDCWQASPFLKAVRECLAAGFSEPCVSCRVLDGCRSGCLAQKVVQHGRICRKPDPMCLRGHGKR